MAEAYDSGVGSFTIKQVVDAFVAFLGTHDPTEAVWKIQKGKVGAPYGDSWNTSFGNAGDPLIIGKTNGTTEEDFIIHLFQNSRRNVCFNLSAGPFDRAVGNIWYDEPNARYGRADNTDSQENVCQMYYSHMTTVVVNQYHFFMYNNYIWVVWKQDDGVWANFGFGHFEKIADFVGGAFVCCTYNSISGSWREDADNPHNVMFVDMIGSSTFEQTNDNWHAPHFRCDTQAGDFRYGVGMYMFNYMDQGGRGGNDEYMGVNDTAGSCGSMFAASDDKLCSFEFDKMRNTSAFGLTAPLIPVYFYIGRERKSYNWSLVGRLDDIFGMNILNYAETSIIQIQGDDYMVFPRARKTANSDTGDGIPNSYQYGFILRKPA